MWKKICPLCNKVRLLTKHSLIGNHQSPFIYLCRECHDKIDRVGPNNKKRTKYIREFIHKEKEKKVPWLID